MAAEPVTITHAEALRLVDARVGEQVYLALFVPRAGSASGGEGPMPFVHRVGRLGNPLAPKPPRLEADVGYYGFGREAFDAFLLPPVTGGARLRDHGIDFLVSDGVRIRIAWRGSEEVGDRRAGAGHLRRAPAQVLDASPTADTVGSGEAKRRVWSLRVRVEPEDGPAFEAEARLARPLQSGVEERIARGESLVAAATAPGKLEVAYEPGDPEQVTVLPDPGAGETTIALGAAIVGKPIGP